METIREQCCERHLPASSTILTASIRLLACHVGKLLRSGCFQETKLNLVLLLVSLHATSFRMVSKSLYKYAWWLCIDLLLELSPRLKQNLVRKTSWSIQIVVRPIKCQENGTETCEWRTRRRRQQTRWQPCVRRSSGFVTIWKLVKPTHQKWQPCSLKSTWEDLMLNWRRSHQRIKLVRETHASMQAVKMP